MTDTKDDALAARFRALRLATGVASARDHAARLGAMYDELRGAGVPPRVAAALVSDFQRALLVAAVHDGECDCDD